MASVMERAGMGLQSMGMPGMGTPTVGSPTGLPAGTNWMMVPRCTLKFEKCTGGMCSCCCMMNGMVCCCCNLTMGICKCEMTKDGCCITCSSGDQKCGEMIQSCCDCMSTLMKSGCTCCVMMNGTPICCC